MGSKGKRVVTLEIRSFHDLLAQRPMASSDELVRINVPVDTKICEYKRIVELADMRGYQIVDEKEKLKVMMQRRREEMKTIDQSIVEFQRMVDQIDRKMIYHHYN